MNPTTPFDASIRIVPQAATPVAEGELTDLELQHVAGGLLDNLMATCKVSGTANILSSNVAIELA